MRTKSGLPKYVKITEGWREGKGLHAGALSGRHIMLIRAPYEIFSLLVTVVKISKRDK